MFSAYRHKYTGGGLSRSVSGVLVYVSVVYLCAGLKSAFGGGGFLAVQFFSFSFVRSGSFLA